MYVYLRSTSIVDYIPPDLGKLISIAKKTRFKNYSMFTTFNNLKMWDCLRVDSFINFSHQSDIFKSVFRFQRADVK